MKIKKTSAALALALALALIATHAGAGVNTPILSSLTVSGSDGKRYVIEVLPNTSINASRSILLSQPWWGSQALAYSLSQQVQGQLGDFHGNPSVTEGVMFAYANTPSTPGNMYLCVYGIICTSLEGDPSESYYWAIGHPALNVTGSVQNIGSYPAQGAARVIDAHANLQNLFGSQISDQQVSNAASQTLPLLTGGSVAATRGALSSINNTIQARIHANRGLSSGDSFLGDKSVWMKPFGSRADQNDRDGVAGFKANTYGVIVGADSTLSPALHIGAAFAYANSDVNGQSSIAPHSVKVDIFQLAGYGSYSFDERTAADFQIDVGQNTNRGHRQISFTSTVASSKYLSDTAHVGVGIDREYYLSDQTTLTPSVRADYTWIKERGYRETGADLLNLNVAARTMDALIIGVDGKLAHKFNDQTTLLANLGVGYDTINKDSVMTAAFAGAPDAAFVTTGIKPSPWLGRGGFGAVYKTKAGLEITARYDVEYRESYLNQTASANMRWSF